MTSPLPPRLMHPLLDLPEIQHGFFTRLGGVSKPPYDSLNVGLGSNDNRDDVLENRARVAACFAQTPDRLMSLYQVHSAKALVVDRPWQDEAIRPEADGLVTKTRGLIVSALSADCATLLFADVKNSVVGACHAGWKGALYGMIEAQIDTLIDQGAQMTELRCVIGPCIAQNSYEVSDDYEAEFLDNDRDTQAFFIKAHSPTKRLFDLSGFCEMRLRRAGLNQVAQMGYDTCADETLFFSNRRAFLKGERDYGRLIAAIMLRD